MIIALLQRYFREKIGEAEREDLASEILYKMLSKLHQWSPAKSKLSTWVGQITRNTAVDYLRKKRPYYTEDHREEVTEMVSPASWFLSSDDVLAIHAWTPWRISADCVREIGQVFLTAKGRLTPVTVGEVGAVFARHGATYARHATVTEAAHFIFGLIRNAKVNENDRLRVRRAIGHYRATSALGLILRTCGPDAATQILLLFGGQNLQIPTVGAITALEPKLPAG